MTSTLSEDDIYRTSTQYRLWSFSPEQLAARRKKTHQLALERARQYAEQQKTGKAQNGEANGHEVEYLTEQEELRLVQRYCEIIIQTTSHHLKWPANIRATAVQYLKRFYLSNSCMTYPPKEIYKTVMFLAAKTEAYHLTVNKFAQSISGDADAILAPEYKVMQALRFTLDVRQPFRGLKGVLMELLNMANGLVGTTGDAGAQAGIDFQRELLTLRPPTSSCRSPWTPPSSTPGKSHLVHRIHAAYETARGLLDAPASVTDAYFLYTPSQILLAAMHLTDAPLTEAYLETKLPPGAAARPQILATIHACAELMAGFDPQGGMSKDERVALEQKLERCRDPTTRDLVKSHAETKGDAGENGQDAKKRRLEREKTSKEMDELFGPSLDGGAGGRKG